MLVFRANTNLFGTDVAWLSCCSWRRPRLVGVSNPGWHYRHWISLAVGGDDLITRPLVHTNVVPWVALHTFPRRLEKLSRSQPLTVSLSAPSSARGPKMAGLRLINSITPTYMTTNDKRRNTVVFKESWNQQYQCNAPLPPTWVKMGARWGFDQWNCKMPDYWAGSCRQIPSPAHVLSMGLHGAFDSYTHSSRSRSKVPALFPSSHQLFATAVSESLETIL